MSIYLAWLPDEGDTVSNGKPVEAFSAVIAAEEFAMGLDYLPKDFPLTICILPTWVSGTEYTFIVDIVYRPSYSAKLIKTEDNWKD